MTAWICRTCGNQYADADEPPTRCVICADERQYELPGDPRWTTLRELIEEGHHNEWRELEPGLYGFRIVPDVGINPRSLFLTTPAGNLLFDVNALPDAETVQRLEALGGVQAIAASHPHFYGAMCDWSAALDGATIHLPEADRQWALRTDAPIEWWEGEREVLPGLRLLQCGGHFEGSAVLHWEEREVLFTGDTIMVVPGSRWVSFMRAYPELIPLPPAKVRAIAERVKPLRFDRVYGNPGWEKVIESGAAEIVQRSADRYIASVTTPQRRGSPRPPPPPAGLSPSHR